MPTYRAPKFNGIQPGTYTLEVVEAKEGKTKKGDDMLILKVCADPGTPPFVERLVLTEKCAGPVARCLAALGMELADGQEIIVENLIGRKAEADVIVDEFNGRQGNKVKRWHLANESKTGGGQ